jgi:hypothetical protein
MISSKADPPNLILINHNHQTPMKTTKKGKPHQDQIPQPNRYWLLSLMVILLVFISCKSETVNKDLADIHGPGLPSICVVVVIGFVVLIIANSGFLLDGIFFLFDNMSNLI